MCADRYTRCSLLAARCSCVSALVQKVERRVIDTLGSAIDDRLEYVLGLVLVLSHLGRVVLALHRGTKKQSIGDARDHGHAHHDDVLGTGSSLVVVWRVLARYCSFEPPIYRARYKWLIGDGGLHKKRLRARSRANNVLLGRFRVRASERGWRALTWCSSIDDEPRERESIY